MSNQISQPRSSGIAGRIVGGAAILFVVLLGLGITGKLKERQALADTTQSQLTLRTVTVVSPKRAAVGTGVTLPATVEAMQEVTLYGRISGYVKTVRADIGDHVAKGQLLAEIESPEAEQALREARAKLEQERANLTLAMRALARYRGLRDQDAVSAQQVDDQEALVNTRKASLEAMQATVQRLEAETGYERIVAPFAGTITERKIDRGDLVTAGSGTTVTSLFTLAETASLRVFVDVPQEGASAMTAGVPAELRLREQPSRIITGTVARTAGALDRKMRTLRTEIHIPNNESLLIPGMYVEVSLKVGDGAPHFLVPSSTVRITPKGPEVVLLRDGVVKAQRITLGRDLGKEIEVLDGLKGDESLVVSPGDALADGQRVVKS